MRNKEKNKVYIAGRITGDPNYREKFAKVEAELTKQGYLVMNPAVLPEGFDYGDYMAITGSMQRSCGTIYMLEDWEASVGARIEHTMAEALGQLIIYQKLPKCPK